MSTKSYPTGATCPHTANYITDCVDRASKEVREEDTFPPCPACNEDVNWSPVGGTQLGS